MCGVVGIVAQAPVNQAIFDALTILQHRGQDAAGMVTCSERKIHLHKGCGLVRDVFDTSHMQRLSGNMGIGHVRYPTVGSNSEEEAQPFYVNSPFGITLAHNGNLTNAEHLKEELIYRDFRHLNTGSDSEILLNVFAHELQKIEKLAINESDIFRAVAAVHRRCEGAYAVVALIAGVGVVAFRDPNGIRPLVYGKRATATGTEYMVASENVACDVLGFKVINDVAPGEAIFISLAGQLHTRQCASRTQCSPCLFEFVYLARPDTFIDKISVYKVRLRLGEHLGKKILALYPDHDIDVVMPIPDTSRPAAATLAQTLGVRFREGFVKNRYIGRTFIMPAQQLRNKSVRQKLNTIPLEFKDKNVLLVDDSIVRGTTSQKIIEMAREAGAKKVYFASAAPAVLYPNVYGIDMAAAHELVAHNRTVAEVAEFIGADWLVYQDLAVLIDAAREGNAAITRFEDSVFTGNYLCGNIDERYLSALCFARNDQAKQQS